MSRIVKGDPSIFQHGNLYKFIKLISVEDLQAANELVNKHPILSYGILGVPEKTFYAGPFLSEIEIQIAQRLINARSDQIRKCNLRKKEIPSIWEFIGKFLSGD